MLLTETTESESVEEETMLLAQTVNPAALSILNYIRQKQEKYTTHCEDKFL